MEEPTIVSLLILLFIILAVVLHFVWIFWPYIVYRFRRSWFNRSITKYYRHKRLIKLEEKLAALEKAPRASFFSRVNGKYTTIEGPEEEQYLSKKRRGKKKNI